MKSNTGMSAVIREEGLWSTFYVVSADDIDGPGVSLARVARSAVIKNPEIRQKLAELGAAVLVEYLKDMGNPVAEVVIGKIVNTSDPGFKVPDGGSVTFDEVEKH